MRRRVATGFDCGFGDGYAAEGQKSGFGIEVSEMGEEAWEDSDQHTVDVAIQSVLTVTRSKIPSKKWARYKCRLCRVYGQVYCHIPIPNETVELSSSTA